MRYATVSDKTISPLASTKGNKGKPIRPISAFLKTSYIYFWTLKRTFLLSAVSYSFKSGNRFNSTHPYLQRKAKFSTQAEKQGQDSLNMGNVGVA